MTDKEYHALLKAAREWFGTNEFVQDASQQAVFKMFCAEKDYEHLPFSKMMNCFKHRLFNAFRDQRRAVPREQVTLDDLNRLLDPESLDFENRVCHQVDFENFLKTLPKKSVKILLLVLQGYTQKEIRKKIGISKHKKIKTIAIKSVASMREALKEV